MQTGSRAAFIDQFPDRQASERESFAQFADACARRQRPLLIENRPRLWLEKPQRPEDDILGSPRTRRSEAVGESAIQFRAG
jgi:hypothetical protein